MPTPKTGPFSRADLMALWKSVTDPSYHQPLLENPDSGLEAIEQGAEQYTQLSDAVDKTTQAFYIQPWSGQTAPPAGGASLASVELQFTRTADLGRVLVITPVEVQFEVLLEDYSADGTIEAPTGRLFSLLVAAVFAPGERETEGPAVSTRAGAIFNLSPAGSIRSILQVGSGFENDGATVELGPGTTHRLILSPEADVLTPAHVGQYITFVSGANAGRKSRLVAYAGPDPSVPHGGVVSLSATGVLVCSGFSGSFTIGEEFEQAVTLARGRVLRVTSRYVVYERTQGDVVAGNAITGLASGASASVDAIEEDALLVAEVGTAGWRVLDWVADLGLSVTNADLPAGGRAAMLDEIGDERGVQRASGEADSLYRKRVYHLPDTVSPNAIRRAANRALSPYGLSACYRDVGDIDSFFPGLFFDVIEPDPRYAYAYDLDFGARPSDRFKLLLDYTEFRAFFLVGVPPISLGEFGMPYDAAAASNAYDAAPYLAFYDGYAVGASAIYRSVYEAVNRARAAGVSFDLYLETYSCA